MFCVVHLKGMTSLNWLSFSLPELSINALLIVKLQWSTNTTLEHNSGSGMSIKNKWSIKDL